MANAEQGRHAGYVQNLLASPEVRIRVHRSWRPAHADVAPDDDPQARLGMFGRSHASAVRRFGTDLLTLRFDFPKD